jgi:hypothetical protein
MKSIMLIFSFSVAALAQPSVVTFSPGECCSTIYQDGKAYHVIRDANVSVMVSASANYSARLHSVFVSVLQLSDTPVDVNPATFSATAEDVNQTVLPYLDEDERAEKERKHKRACLVFCLLLALAPLVLPRPVLRLQPSTTQTELPRPLPTPIPTLKHVRMRKLLSRVTRCGKVSAPPTMPR